jgi:hypothetical protein
MSIQSNLYLRTPPGSGHLLYADTVFGSWPIRYYITIFTTSPRRTPPVSGRGHQNNLPKQHYNLL